MASGSMRSSRIAGLPRPSTPNAARNSSVRSTTFAVRAECARIRGEIPDSSVRCRTRAGVLALLVHADRAGKAR